MQSESEGWMFAMFVTNKNELESNQVQVHSISVFTFFEFYRKLICGFIFRQKILVLLGQHNTHTVITFSDGIRSYSSMVA